MLGHEVTVVDARTDAGREYLAEDVKLVEVNSFPQATLISPAENILRKRVKSWSNNFKYIHETVSKAHVDEFDVVHVHVPEQALILNRRYRKRYFYTSHTPYWCLQRQCACRKTTWKKIDVSAYVDAKIEAGVVKNSMLTIALGDYLKKCIPGAVIETVPNGLDLAKWRPMDQQLERRKLGFRDGDFIAIFIGRVSPVKGVDVLLRAAHYLASELKNLKVLIIGSLSGSFNIRNEITPYARKLVEESKLLPVHFVGFVNNKSQDFRVYLSAADVAVVPSLLESQVLVVLEALDMGKPVIGSDTGGIPAMVTGDVGCLFPPGDSFALARKIKDLHDNPEGLARMQQDCRARVEAHYTWAKVARRHLQAFTKGIELSR
jgi:glycosyltransferase involved in cell wall biosynthesis